MPLHKKKNDESNEVTPTYGSRSLTQTLPKYEMPQDGMPPRNAYDIVHDELMLDGNARLNLATFVTTWMEPEAKQLMTETFNKNMIDKDEYPQTTELENRCIAMLTKLWNAPETGNTVGCSTVGSSEACMLAGMAFKWKWRDFRRKHSKSTDKPNLVMGINVQVCWEKFCRYWDIEMRLAPMEENDYTLTADKMRKLCDENTIGVVAILGSTFTGQYEPIEEIHDALVTLNRENNWEIPMHIDAASGGMVAPFLQPNLKWDFRLPLVKSINTSGHKYGLVYPGIGWVMWRDSAELHPDLVFDVNYLGGSMPTFTLNFSRPGNQVVAQYYNFIRLGKKGYTRIQQACQNTAQHLALELNKLGIFNVIHNGSDLPVVSWKIKNDANLNFDVFDLSERLRMSGWQVPAYTLPANIEQIAIMRVVIREGTSLELIKILLKDIKLAMTHFEKQKQGEDSSKRSSFHH